MVLTIKARLASIQDSELPHYARVGNSLPSTASRVLAVHDGNIPEVIVDFDDGLEEEIGNAKNIFIGRLRSETGYIEKVVFHARESDEVRKTTSGKMNAVSGDRIECHAFYNPLTETTHYFICPKGF